jgi:hypothetical protein
MTEEKRQKLVKNIQLLTQRVTATGDVYKEAKII